MEEQTVPRKKPAHHLIAEVPRKRSKIELTIGIDLGDVWSHYCTLSQQGEVIDRGRFRTTPKAIDKWFTDVPHAGVAMEAGGRTDAWDLLRHVTPSIFRASVHGTRFAVRRSGSL